MVKLYLQQVVVRDKVCCCVCSRCLSGCLAGYQRGVWSYMQRRCVRSQGGAIEKYLDNDVLLAAPFVLEAAP